MPNIPPLASSVVKSKYFAGAVLFLAWVAFILLMPAPLLAAINAGLAGYYVGTELHKLTLKWEQRFANTNEA